MFSSDITATIAKNIRYVKRLGDKSELLECVDVTPGQQTKNMGDVKLVNLSLLSGGFHCVLSQTWSTYSILYNCGKTLVENLWAQPCLKFGRNIGSEKN